jgi:hypothetical protein
VVSVKVLFATIFALIISRLNSSQNEPLTHFAAQNAVPRTSFLVSWWQKGEEYV